MKVGFTKLIEIGSKILEKLDYSHTSKDLAAISAARAATCFGSKYQED